MTTGVLLGPVAIADFNDDQYHELVLFDWDTPELDVIVVPPAAPNALSRLAAINQAMDAWDAGVDALAPSWLADGFSMNRYTLGQDVPPPEALADPEIIVVSGEANPFVLAGIGLPLDYLVCDLFFGENGEVGTELPVDPDEFRPGVLHQHEDSAWGVMMGGTCSDSTENVCVALNTNFALNANGQRRMYDLSAHEVGHCLGIGHVGDALDFSATTFPGKDIMSYQFTPSQVHCVSSLNVAALSGVYAQVLGRPASEWLDYGDYVHMDPSSYTQVACANPPPPTLP